MCATICAEKKLAIANEADGRRMENGSSSSDISRHLREKLKLKRTTNPFKLPANTNYAVVLEEDKQRRKSKFKQMLTSPVHQKVPARHMSFTNVMQTVPSVPELVEKPPSPTSEITSDPDFLQALAKGETLRNMEDLTTFVHNKREMFLIQYMIGIKRDEILRLGDKERREGDRLTTNEKCLEEGAVKFSDFLRLNDREAVDAVKQAEMETRIKLDKVAEIKKINVLIVNYKSKISKLEDILVEYKTYAKFLNSVAPQEWKQQKMIERQKAQEMKARSVNEGNKDRLEKNEKSAMSLDKSKRIQIVTSVTSTTQLPVLHQGKKSVLRRGKDKISTKSDHDADDQSISSNVSALQEMMAELQLSSELVQYLTEDDDDEKVELYFSDPKQLPAIFSDLLEQNLLLIQTSQETEESLEEVVTNFSWIKKNMTNETKLLRGQVGVLEDRLKMERKKASEFEIMAKMHSFGKYSDEDQEKLLIELNVKVEEVYTKILGPNDANLNALQMMTGIETRLDELLETLESLPHYKILEAMKLRERQRRMDQRKEKIREQEEYLLQRKLRTMAKAMEKRSTFIGRKLLARSVPQFTETKSRRFKVSTRSEEEIVFFFT